MGVRTGRAWGMAAILLYGGCTYVAGSRDGAPCDSDAACRDGQVCDPITSVCVDADGVSAGDDAGTAMTDDGDPMTDGDGDPMTDGDGDPMTGGDGDPTTDDGDPTTGGDGDSMPDDGTQDNCGDGVVTGDEECDDAGESETCNEDCTVAVCGDGILNITAGEVCDDGNTLPNDSCPPNCGYCDPLDLNTCPDGNICVASYQEDDVISGFICFPPAGEGLWGEPCECSNCCSPGYICALSDIVGPDCGADFCCTGYCDLTMGDGVCQLSNQACVPIFEPTHPQFANLGICQVPI